MIFHQIKKSFFNYFILSLTILLMGFNQYAIACGNYYLDKDGNRISVESIPINYSAEKTEKLINNIKKLYHQKSQKHLPVRIINNLVAIQKQGAELDEITDDYLNQIITLLIPNMIADKTNYFVKLAELVNFDFIVTFDELKEYDEFRRMFDDNHSSDIFTPSSKKFVLDAAKEHKRSTSDYLYEIRH